MVIISNKKKKVAPFAVYKEVADTWTDPETGKKYHGIYTPVWRWRRAFYHDFVCRMDWCIKPYGKANHHPVAAFSGDKGDSIVKLRSTAGEVVKLDASASSDPDGNKLEFLWWIYKEAGTCTEEIKIRTPRKHKASLAIPENAAGTQIHVVLQVKDRSPIAALYDYRRIVIDVTK